MADLGFDVDGPQGAPVVVLAPSLGTGRAMWSATAHRLADRFRVVSIDLLGHGDSAVPAGPYTIERLGRAVLALLDELGVATAHYAGVSLGGMTGMWLAARAGERIDRLALVCTAAYLPHRDAYRDRAAAVRAHGTASIADAVTARWFTPAFRDRHPDVAAGYAEALARTPDEGYAACCEAIAAMDLRGLLPAITAPTLVLSGAEDVAIPPDLGAATAAAVPGARFRAVDRAAHLANVARPAEVTALLGDFLLGGLVPGRSPAGGSRAGENPEER